MGLNCLSKQLILLFLPLAIATNLGWDINPFYGETYMRYNSMQPSHDKKGSNGTSWTSSILRSDQISEWEPISWDIVPGERNKFQFNVNSTVSLSSTYEILIFLSGNICSQPANVTGQSLRVYYSFDESMVDNLSIAEAADFSLGYMEALAIRPYEVESNSTETYSTLYLLVELVDTASGKSLPASQGSAEPWSYRISISQNDLAFQYDAKTWIDVVDTDHNSALLTTGNMSTFSPNHGIADIDLSLYDLLLYSSDHIDQFNNLSRSICAIANGPILASSLNTVTHFENSTLSSTELQITKSITTRGGQIKEQFHITGLNSSTTYLAYLTKKVSNVAKNTTDTGGVIFERVIFKTMENNSCSLIFGLEFCNGVAYSVPTSSKTDANDKILMAGMYDDIAKSLYFNFSLALELIPCHSDADSIYSPLRRCEDCASSYKNWLCAVSIPRCTTDESDYYVFRKSSDNRNDLINDSIEPTSDYYEILPCINMCYAMVRDCPSEFNFACPNKSKYPNLLYSSYREYIESAVIPCNFVGNMRELSDPLVVR
ncbi:Mid1p Ecym_3533 [Eremothecium cymbalariae DBVPG|uniref:Stretch-activated cation channel MID1 n=1 Tax=Eremothecium cymbalariae (strain CBS 270.75 / DBVPG 7215 / KCTC 17166 / NRRL Y-17582) TaxID=931890 RepID=G8JQM6_ERECY|nr:Hypothetical protein Ecym_3533 [Eremothecium cymbalariae DBVPG\